ncbi:MAG: tRNA (adenosine(37)-N6)-threonylcarbamoyltransferase complex ATPase subunit type 1 TsaE [Firmicutes bacterium]|nr:tRNA (adenosine(37)-N6)-threonylcarbamoyltransferase complex ATPase subunit type 1 TsaE [Bacillota bacterium]
MDVIVSSPQETKELGVKLGNFLRPGDVISLNGSLGSGKTYFVKGIGIGLGISEELVTSPTFKLINQYEGILPLYHFDVYRIKPEEIEDLGYEDYFYGKGVSIIEWGNNVIDYLPEDYLEVLLKKTSIDNERHFTFIAHGQRYEKLLADFETVVEI